MNTATPTRRSPNSSEEGYILVAVIFMLAILIIALTVAAPRIVKSIQRERELETMHRGKQYARAVKLYYKQFNTFPPNVDALVKTNEVRYLRKKYIDPTTGKEEWKAIPYGQQKTQTLGFFGQPIGGGGMAGAGLNGVNGLAGPTPIGGTSTSGGIFGSSSGATPSGGSTPSGSTDSGSGAAASGTSTDPSGSSGGTNGSGTGGTSSGAGTSTNTNQSIFGPPTGQTFGGIGIMGFSPNSPKQSILFYKKKNHYNEWEFFYDPLADQLMMQGGNTGAIGTPINGANGTSPIGSGSTFGGSSGIGNSSGFGSSGGSNFGSGAPTPPSNPQQPQ
jgi:type II secretory pathway pseudopilin PulG